MGLFTAWALLANHPIIAVAANASRVAMVFESQSSGEASVGVYTTSSSSFDGGAYSSVGGIVPLLQEKPKCIALSSDGSTFIVGIPPLDSSDATGGTVAVFGFDTTATPPKWKRKTTVAASSLPSYTPSPTQFGAQFGSSFAVSGDGTILAFGGRPVVLATTPKTPSLFAPGVSIVATPYSFSSLATGTTILQGIGGMTSDAAQTGWCIAMDQSGNTMAVSVPGVRRLYAFDRAAFATHAGDLTKYIGYYAMPEDSYVGMTVGPVAVSTDGSMLLVGTTLETGPAAAMVSGGGGAIVGFSDAKTVINNTGTSGILLPTIRLPLPLYARTVGQIVISRDRKRVAATLTDVGGCIVYEFATKTIISANVSGLSVGSVVGGGGRFAPALGVAFIDDTGDTVVFASSGGGSESNIGKSGGALVFTNVPSPPVTSNLTVPIGIAIGVSIIIMFLTVGVFTVALIVMRMK